MPAPYDDVGIIGYHLFDFLEITGLDTLPFVQYELWSIPVEFCHTSIALNMYV